MVKGVSCLQAELRAAVFLALEEQDKVEVIINSLTFYYLMLSCSIYVCVNLCEIFIKLSLFNRIKLPL